MSLKLFNSASDARNQRAYKVYIEPYNGGAKDFLGYSEMAKIVLEKLNVVNSSYKKQWGENLIDKDTSTVIYNNATIIADNDDESSSLSFNYNVTWEQSKISDIVGDFIPSAASLSVGRILAKGVSVAGKIVTGASAYHGTYPSLNLNDRKLMAKPDFMKYNIKLKVIDKDGTGEVLKTLTKLLIYSVPLTTNAHVDVKDLADGINKAVKITAELVTNAAGVAGTDVPAIAKDFVKTVANTGGTIVSALTAAAGKILANDGIQKTFKTLTGMTPNIELIGTPVPLTIYISSFYVHQLCVIDSVGVNLSKQVNVNGYPVYGVFDLSISSRELSPLDLGATGDTDSPNVLRNISFMGADADKNVWNQPIMLRNTPPVPIEFPPDPSTAVIPVTKSKSTVEKSTVEKSTVEKIIDDWGVTSMPADATAVATRLGPQKVYEVFDDSEPTVPFFRDMWKRQHKIQ